MARTVKASKRKEFSSSFGKRNALVGKYGRRNDWKTSLRREGMSA